MPTRAARLDIAVTLAGGQRRPRTVAARTVENHLQRVYAKLGITRREDLPAPPR